MSSYKEIPSTYNRSWQTRRINMTCHSYPIQLKTGIPYKNNNYPLTASRPSRLGLQVLNTTCLLTFHSPPLFSILTIPLKYLSTEFLFYCNFNVFTKLFLSAQSYERGRVFGPEPVTLTYY